MLRIIKYRIIHALLMLLLLVLYQIWWASKHPFQALAILAVTFLIFDQLV